MDAESSVFSESLPYKGFYRYGFVCILSITSDTNLHCMETRFSQLCNRCISTEFGTQIPLYFSLFCMIPKVLNKTLKEEVPKLILMTPARTTQVCYPKILNMSIKSPILLPWRKDLLKDLKREIHLLVQNWTLQLVAWTVFRQDCRRREFQR